MQSLRALSSLLLITGLLSPALGAHQLSASDARAPEHAVAGLEVHALEFSGAVPAAQETEGGDEAAGGTGEVQDDGILADVDAAAGKVADWIQAVIFYPILEFEGRTRDGKSITVPLVILWLILGALFFTMRMGFINVRGFAHAIQVVRGKFDRPEDEGEVSHFQALASALSATVGLGNIAGVAIAVGLGGPGAIFWMILAGFLGMSSKFAECTLGQRFRRVRSDGTIMGGAMYYLSIGLKEKGLGGLGKILAVMFAVFCIGGSLGGGNTFQVNQSLGAVRETIPFFDTYPWVYGLVMTVAVGIVIVGGIRRIAAAAERIVPVMCGIYLLASFFILAKNFGAISDAFGLIIGSAFEGDALFGGFIGSLVIGFKRSAFSNEAGVGSAAIAHSAAKTDYPVREGIVALLGPFIDTIIVCTMTGLVIVITGAYENPAYEELVVNDRGAQLTSNAYGEQISWFPYVLSLATMMFAYSTIISWSYYGERCFTYLAGDKASIWFRLGFLPFVFLGSIVNSTNIKDLSDAMIFAMAFPNILGVALLSPIVARELKEYMAKLKSGELKVYK